MMVLIELHEPLEGFMMEIEENMILIIDLLSLHESHEVINDPL